MPVSFTSREFNRDPAAIKRAALAGPVFITERGRSSLVVMAAGEYRRLTGSDASLLDVLAPGDDQDFDFDPPRARPAARAVDLG